MDTTTQTSRLVAILRSGSTETQLPTLLDHFAFYAARVAEEPLLIALLEALFYSPLLKDQDASRLYTAARSAASSKLQVSLPSLPVPLFFRAWDRCFAACSRWSIPQLALLSGSIGVSQEFEQLQRRYFIDDSGHVAGMLLRWRSSLLLPMLAGMMNVSTSEAARQTLIELYAGSAVPSDADNRLLTPLWDTIASSALQGVVHTILDAHDTACPRLSDLTRLLQLSLPRASPATAQYTLTAITSAARELPHLTTATSVPSDFYFRRYVALVIATRGCLESRPQVPVQWYKQALRTLQRLNFIAIDLGTAGFSSYEYVYEVSVLAVGEVAGMAAELAVDQGAPAQLFLLDYIARAAEVHGHAGLALEQLYSHVHSHLGNRDARVRNAAHFAAVALLAAPDSSPSAIQWKQHHLQPYATLSTDQYRTRSLSGEQLEHIFRALAVVLPAVHSADPDAARRLLHMLYRAVVNTPAIASAHKVPLLRCIALLVPQADPRYAVAWLENVRALSRDLSDPEQLSQVEKGLWEVVSASRNDAMLRWWSNCPPLSRQSRL
ncbi:Pex8 protein [Maudiozyma humilis]|uniref:Pex8 protein n=1 Tax=Maudiozyma humilis TaxID=51915 RepID=A0AAV5S5H6_MAUHU|nr:Pex8 protein [Kazachstania humilis]